MNRTNPLFLLLFLIACSVLAGCVSGSPAHGKRADFSGTWSVQWCSKTEPSLDCGGFNVSLVQRDESICGDFGGALVGLRQVDEGTVVGSAVGYAAILVVESQRNQAIALVRAERSGDTMRWKVVDDVKRGNSDIDVIALDDTLIRDGAKEPSAESHIGAGVGCP
jgi:hypothetical protein